jgi:hypothetical protein
MEYSEKIAEIIGIILGDSLLPHKKTISRIKTSRPLMIQESRLQ